MSTSAKRIRNGFLFAFFFLICAAMLGFFFGQYKQPPPPIEPPQAAYPARLEDQLALGELPAERPVLNQPYQIVQPTIGLLQVLLPVSFISTTYSDDGTGEAIIHRTDSRIAQMMETILYDAQDQPLSKKGTVLSVSDTQAILSLPKMRKQPVRADIILASNFMARRLPNEARDGDFVWKAILMSDGTYMAKRTPIEPPTLSNDKYFDVYGVRSDEYIIANPDANLQDNATLTTVALTYMDTPTIDPQQVAEQRAAQEYVDQLLYSISMSPPPPELNPPGNSCPLPALIPLPE